MSRLKAASSSRSGACPFMSRDTTVASHPRRSLPSTRVFLTSECSRAAAVSERVA
jgi:hypothetical protein